MSETMLARKFERTHNTLNSESIARTSMLLGKVTMQFARIERVPRFHDSRRESDVEHSFMLALLAPELADALELPFDSGLLAQFAVVHDLIELKTNDIPTLLLNEEQLHQKEVREQQALSELLEELPPHTAHLLERYERQDEPESRFVRFVDKLLPIVVDILGDGRRVLQEDYNIHTREGLEATHGFLHERLHKKFGTEFPEISQAHRELTRIAELLIQFKS